MEGKSEKMPNKHVFPPSPFIIKESTWNFNDIIVLELPDDFYAIARASDPYKCSRELKDEYIRTLGKHDASKLCDYDHYMYYAATDKALRDLVATCRTCTHVLVTNGDNGYAPSFLTESLAEDTDLVVAAFTHAARPHAPAIKLGALDLGAVLMKKEVLRHGTKSFLSSLPPQARAREVHDADYWFVQDAVDRGMTYTILTNRTLMYHH